MANDGFFSRSVAMSVKKPLPTLALCDRCKLYTADCCTPKMKPTGEGKRSILLVGDCPGEVEDSDGRQFTGSAGQYLEGVLRDYGVDMRQDCISTNATICYSPNIEDHKTALQDCRPNLINTITKRNPDVIVLLGPRAVSSLCGYLWHEDIGSIAPWVGWRIPSQRLNRWVCPTWNPEYIRKENEKSKPNRALEFHFRRHIEQAIALSGTRPWPDGTPDYARRVEVITDTSRAVEHITRFNEHNGGTMAFDIEADRLKPDADDSDLVCCSICWEGESTIAFPWNPAVQDAMKVLLENPNIGKIGANIQYETRWMWTRGINVRGWVHDTVQEAHNLDTRTGTSGVKFQSFVTLGVPPYNEHIESFLRSARRGGNARNSIRSVGMHDLLLYCGMDSVIEYELAKVQAEQLGVEF